MRIKEGHEGMVVSLVMLVIVLVIVGVFKFLFG
jgi:hypothetical protein